MAHIGAGGERGVLLRCEELSGNALLGRTAVAVARLAAMRVAVGGGGVRVAVVALLVRVTAGSDERRGAEKEQQQRSTREEEQQRRRIEQ